MPSSYIVMKKPAAWALVASLFLALLFVVGPDAAGAGDTRTITGLDGSTTEIPSDPKRIACFYHPAYDKIVMLSKASRIALMPERATPWAHKFYPELKVIPTAAFNTVPDAERLLKLKVDLVFYPKGHVDIGRVLQAGIPALCPFNDGFIPSTMAEYTAEFRKQILFFGDVLGPDARVRAEKYCAYLENVTARVQAITSKVREADKPRVYYGKMSDLYSTQGNNTIMRWYTELAGGIYLPKTLQKYFAQVNMERIVAWDPDIILLGMNGAFDSATTGEGFRTLRAARSGKVYRVPAGIFYWDMTSCETALLPLFLSKRFHPALFKDWDIIREMKRFYSEIYGINLSGRDAERILGGLPPL
jgi:iron complex transport system substrate-binding protein